MLPSRLLEQFQATEGVQAGEKERTSTRPAPWRQEVVRRGSQNSHAQARSRSRASMRHLLSGCAEMPRPGRRPNLPEAPGVLQLS